MFKATMDKLRQLFGVAAIAVLAALPFSSLVNPGQRIGLLRAFEPPTQSEASSGSSIRIDHPTPSYEDLVPALEQVRSARMEVLRCAAQQVGNELERALERYRQAIRVWKDKFRMVQERTNPDEARDLW